MRAGCWGDSDPPGPVCPVPGLLPPGSPPSLPGPLCLLSQGTPFHDHHLPGHPDADTAVSSSRPSPFPTLPPVKVLTLASVSSGRLGLDWELSLWNRVSVAGEKAKEKHHYPPNGMCYTALWLPQAPTKLEGEGESQGRMREGFKLKLMPEIRPTSLPLPEETGKHQNMEERWLHPTLSRALLPSPSKVPANSSAAALEGLQGAWGALSDSRSILDSGPRVSTGRFWGGAAQAERLLQRKDSRTKPRGALLGCLGLAALLRDLNPHLTKI